MNDPELTGAYQPDGTAVPAADIASGPPSQIGRYRIEKVLGKGGFGLVYLAHDDRLQRLVAIKVPHRKLVDRSEEAEAYLTEARTVANLDHPNIVPVHDVGSTGDCPCFVVSKYIDGTDLASRFKQSRPSIHEAVELVATVAEALHHAHKQGLVHRDIKPGNILLDKKSKPFVADFGLALREQDVGNDGSLTMVDLCEQLVVSERSLNYAFKEIWGQTPMTWYRMKRLNAVRRTLKQADPRHTSISRNSKVCRLLPSWAFRCSLPGYVRRNPFRYLSESCTTITFVNGQALMSYRL
jgi:serine/threonine protein kinase